MPISHATAERPSSGRDRRLSLMEAGGEASWRAGEEERTSYHHQPWGDTFRVRVSRPSVDVPLSCEVDLWDGKLVISTDIADTNSSDCMLLVTERCGRMEVVAAWGLKDYYWHA